jgi:nitroimidazol reductase NimA-like FMN-containing flavoprotein (pyridoxamine 5'-phosphate oxidase superfamily)
MTRLSVKGGIMRGEVRAKNLELNEEDSLEIIERADYGVLATVGADGMPSAVALNHVLVDGVLYFHCGHQGEKLDNIKANPQVSFFVVGEAEVVYDQFREIYSSAVVQGRAEIISDEAERLAALKALVYRFSNHIVPREVADSFTEDKLDTVEIIKLTPRIVTGKARLQRKRPGLEY